MKNGDLVRLKSGGPLMVVNGFSTECTNEQVACAWFDGEVLREHYFYAVALELAGAAVE